MQDRVEYIIDGLYPAIGNQLSGQSVRVRCYGGASNCEWLDERLNLFRPIMFNLCQGKEPDLDTARQTWNEKLQNLTDTKML